MIVKKIFAKKKIFVHLQSEKTRATAYGSLSNVRNVATKFIERWI